MRKLKLFLSLLMVMLLSIGQMWAVDAAVDDVLWSEDFSGFSNNADPSGTYSSTHSGTTVFSGSVTYEAAAGTDSKPKVATEASGATGMNLLLYKKNGTFTVSNIPTGGATEVTLAYYKGGSGTLSITGSSNITINGSTITINSGESFSLTFKNTHNSNNLRLDNLSVVVKTAGEGGGDEPGGDEPGEDPDPTDDADVTLNLLDAGWGFPTSKVVAETSYTNGDYTIKVAGNTGNGFRVYDTYFLFGKTGAYLELPVFTSPIEKIVVSGGSSQGSTTVSWNIYQGSDAVSTAASGCTETAYTFNIAPANQKANVAHSIKVTSNSNLQISAIKIYFGEAAAVEAPSVTASGKFVDAKEVSMSCSTEGATIYYTTNGSTPTSTSTPYTAAFNVEETTTIKAIAILGASSSAVTERVYTKVTPLTTMAEVHSAMPADGNATIDVTITDWIVTGAKDGQSQVWFTNADNTKGILLYKSGHGFVAGKKINGTVFDATITKFNGGPELTTLTASQFTVTDAPEITPSVVTIADLNTKFPADQGRVVKLENVTYNGSAFTDETNSITIDTRFLDGNPTLINGSKYNLTGVVFYGNNVIKIMPRSVDDIVAQSVVVVPTAANLAALKAAARGTYILTLENAVVTYVNGKNAFIEDATGGALIFFQDHGFTAGDCLNGDYQVNTTDYQGKFEITSVEPQAGAATTTAEIPLTTVSIATLNANFASYESRRVKIEGANVTNAISGDDRNGAISDGAALAVYAGVASTITLAENNNVDIIGYPGFHNTDEQLTVWAQADITVNSSEPPVVDPRKVAESPEGGFSSVSGNLSGNEISFAAYQGGSATAPNGNNTAHELRLYKYQESTNYGGYVTITAKTGCTIDQVVITVGGNCKVGYCKDAENFPTKEDTPINVSTSNPFDTDKGLGASSVNVVNLDGSNQFKIKTITVYYTGEGIDLESIAISGDASVLEYTEGDAFNPAGLSVIGHYSDNSEAEITEGITWAFDPATLSTTDKSVSVTATVGEITSTAFVVNGLTVNAAVAPTPSTDNVIILATHGTKLYAMTTTNSSNAFAAIEVVEDGSNIVVPSEEAKAAIQWTRVSNGITATFQDADSKYLTAENNGTNLNLGDAECAWKWYAGTGKNCYSIENEDETKLRSFLYYSNNGIFKNYAISNAGGNYSGIAEVRVIAAENIIVVAPTTHTLSYNANGGTLMEGKDEITDAQVAENATVTVAANVYEKEGYVFAGWLYGETVYNAGQTFDMPTEDVELVAQWTVMSTDNVVILAKCQGQWYAVQGVAGASNHTVAAVPVVYQDNVIYLVESKRASITWERTAAGSLASFKNGENYLIGKTSDNNDLDLGEDECWWSLNTDLNIYQTHASHCLLYSSQVGLFKNYKTSNKSADGETGNYSALPIVVPAVFGDPSYTTVREELAPNAYYTMCLDKAVDAVQGGSIWRVLSKAQNDKDIILEEVTGTLQAGRPYIFYATSDIFKVVYAGSAVLEPVNDDDNNGLIGSFIQKKIAQSDDNYIIYNNALYFVNSDNVYVGANRAYLDMTGVPAYNNEPQQGNAPRRRVTMTVYNEQTTTDIDALNASETPVKVIIEGKLYIIRGEKMFNANGQLVK